MWTPVRRKRTEFLTAQLLAPQAIGYPWIIAVFRPNSEYVWEGVAQFPSEMGEQAHRRFEELNDDVDVENLIREWSVEPTLDDFQAFLAYDDA